MKGYVVILPILLLVLVGEVSKDGAEIIFQFYEGLLLYDGRDGPARESNSLPPN